MSDIEVINNDKFLIKIQDNKNNTTRVINKVISLKQADETFTQIANSIKVKSNTNCTFDISSESVCKIFCEEEITLNGYIFSTTTIVNKIIYELTLIKIDENIYFLDDNLNEYHTSNKSTQYEENDISNETETQTEAETQSKNTCILQFEPILESIYEGLERDVEDGSVSDFGEFQESCLPYNYNYWKGDSFEYNNDANKTYSDKYEYNYDYNYNYDYDYNYNYECSLIAKEYNISEMEYQYPSITGIQVSQVPSICTQTNSWSPELMDELAYRLNLPNKGLNMFSCD